MKMRLQNTLLTLLIIGVALVWKAESRRIRVRPQEQEEETVQYYSAEPQDADSQDRVVYISSADQYNGLYGQPSASSRSSHDNYIPSSRNSLADVKSRVKEPAKAPPVQTIRNYNKVNDDGSFTFGYEAADGSFKEETRGTDCVVRGKYGYVDPDGNKREFTYVSGNPCDPNAPKEEDDKPEEDSNEPENIPANYPIRPIRPNRPISSTPAPKPVISLYQSNYAREEEEPEPEQILKPQPIQPARSRPVYIPRPQYIPETQTEQPQIYHRPQIYTTIPSTTPASVIYKNTLTPINITPRPTPRPQQPITTYRPQSLQLSVTPRPALLYTKPIPTRPILPLTTPSPFTANRGGNIDFDAEFQKFQQENNVLAPTPATTIPKAITKAKPLSTPSVSSGQVYSSELIFDPSSGQYNTQLYQALPQTDGEFSLNQKIQPYVHQPQAQTVNIQQLQQQSPLYRQQPRPQLNQALYQQQQAELQFQNSAQLYAQQQKARQQQQQQQQQQLQQPTAPQQYYYIQPSAVPQSTGYTSGQIDAFLRGHNIQF